MKNIKIQVDENQNPSTQSSGSLKTDSVSVTSVRCPTCNAPAGRECWPRWAQDETPHQRRFDNAGTAGLPELGREIVGLRAELETTRRNWCKEITKLQVERDSLRTALKECIKQMRTVRGCTPDEFDDAINSGEWTLALADGRVTNTDASSGTTVQDQVESSVPHQTESNLTDLEISEGSVYCGKCGAEFNPEKISG